MGGREEWWGGRIKDGSWPGSPASDDDCFHPALAVASAHLVPEARFALHTFRRLDSWYVLFQAPSVSASPAFRRETQ